MNERTSNAPLWDVEQTCNVSIGPHPSHGTNFIAPDGRAIFQERAWMRETDAARILACLNFCREFPTSAIDGRHLKYITAETELKSPFDNRDAEGWVACTLLPVVKDEPVPKV